MARETEIEQYLGERAREMGGRAYKFISPGCSGVPDRMVILPGGRVGFLELKASGKTPRKDQEYRMTQLRGLGCMAAWADSRVRVDEFLERLEAGGLP